jgi:hypothetical protein
LCRVSTETGETRAAIASMAGTSSAMRKRRETDKE